MATEGQIARGPNGERAVFTGGQWVVMPADSGQAVMLPAAPEKPQQAPVRTEAGGATEGLKPGFMWVDPNNPAAGQVKIPFVPNASAPDANERLQQIKASLEAVQEARKMANEPLAVGSWSEFLAGTPGLNQNRRNIDAVLENATASLVQDKIKELAEANQGGVSGMANTATEALRMAASIANLTANQDVPSLMQQLERAENYYLRQAAMIQGKQAPDEATLSEFLPEARRKELTATPVNPAMGLATDGVTQEPIPPAMQQALTRYLVENQRDLDPSQYAAFYNGLAGQYGFAPRSLTDSVEAAQGYRDFFAKGGDPASIQISNQRQTTGMEDLANRAANNAVGAGVASFANSALAGLPGLLSGNNEAMEAVRQNSPVGSFVGDMAGGIAGTVGAGGAAARLGARGLAANPMVQNAVFGGLSGATQSEDTLMGAAVGLAGSIGGDVLGRQVGRALPDVFGRSAMREATESVPTSGELGNQADRMYRAAAANGQMIQPPQTNQFVDDSEAFLRSNGFIDQQGNILGTGPVQDATQLLRSFRDQPIGPQEAQTIRNKIAEGRTAMREGAPDNQARMFSGQMTDRFDQFAEAQNALPGIAGAREVAQRRIMGRELDRATEMGQARGDINYSQGSEDLGIRRAFGALDTGEIRGTKLYPDDVQEAIRTVSRGTPARNAAQMLGRFSPQGGGGLFGGGALGGLAATASGDMATGGMVTGALYGTGLFGRKIANNMTRRDAELASMVARGGPQFQAMLRQAQEEAAINGQRVGAGLFGAGAIMPMRD